MLDAAADDSDDGDGDGGAEQLLPKLRSDESFLREWLEAEPNKLPPAPVHFVDADISGSE